MIAQFLEEKDTHNFNANVYTLILLRFYIINNNRFTILRYEQLFFLPASCYLLFLLSILLSCLGLFEFTVSFQIREVVFLFQNWLINLHTSHKSLVRASFRVSFPLLC